MNRRGFLRNIAGLVGGLALEQAIPLGRVWSFPKDIKPLNFAELLAVPGEAKSEAIWRGDATDFDAVLTFMWANYAMRPTEVAVSPAGYQRLLEVYKEVGAL